MIPPPDSESPDRPAYYQTATHRDGGTWSAIESTPEEAEASMRRQLECFPGTYTHVGKVGRCGVSMTQWGPVWRVGE